MTRRRERRRRLAQWAAILAGGAAAAAILAPVVGWWALAALAPAAAAGHRRMILPPGVAVLTYHSVSPDARWLPWSPETSVHPDTFAAHLAALDAMGARVVSSDDLVARRGGDVVLHFDDGYLDNYRFAAPILRAAAKPATFYASLDFVEPAGSPRPAGDHGGYMTWAELKALDADPLFAVEPHGVDHARVPVSDRAVDRLTPVNWRHHAWLQWRATPGAKHDWFRRDTPAAVALGSTVPESRPALAAPATGETAADLLDRIERDLMRSRDRFVAELGRPPATFCWPENACVPDGRRIAAALGYRATTAGKGRNTGGEPAEIISRVHAGDRALGVRWLPAERLHLRATVRAAQGNLYWYLLLAPMNAIRRAVMAARTRAGHFA